MKKIKGTVDRIESEKVVIRYNGNEAILDKDLMKGFKEGDSVVLVVANNEEDKKKSNKVARELLTQVLKGE